MQFSKTKLLKLLPGVNLVYCPQNVIHHIKHNHYGVVANLGVGAIHCKIKYFKAYMSVP